MSDFSPTLDDVAALVPSRAKNQYGRITTFDDTTQPTGDQVQSIIDRASLYVFARIGEPVDALKTMATDLVAMRAAMLVELTYFGDQVKADRSPYQELQALYTQGVADYLASRSQLGSDETPGTADDQSPFYGFPAPAPIVHAPGAEIPADPEWGPIW